MLLICVGAMSQEITVRFTGQLNGANYCQLDSVLITNTTRGWSETVVYPDTVIVLGSMVNISNEETFTQGLGQNVPNPFNCKTCVEFTISQQENVVLQLLDAGGKVYAEYNSLLGEGSHKFNISAANPQTYILNAFAGKKNYSIKMVNVGSGCANFITYAGSSTELIAKLTSTNEFHIGDPMEYVGYTTIENQVVISETISQSQIVSQHLIMNFSHASQPTVETLFAEEITATSAILKGNIISDGDSEILTKGFYYGIDSNNLSNNIIVETANFSVDIQDLDPNTMYYYCAYASNSVGVNVGEIMNFTTLNPDAITIVTNEASDIMPSTAMLNGNIVANGGHQITSRGFYWGNSADNLNNTILAGVGVGQYSSHVSNLMPNTTYYYCAFATSNYSSDRGNVVSFTTDEEGTIVIETGEIDKLCGNFALLNGSIIDDGNAQIVSRGFYIGLSADNMSDVIICDTEDNVFSYLVMNLTNETTYYYCAFITTLGSSAIGEIKTFTTLDFDCPIDYDGNVYMAKRYGEQIWMVENIRTTHYDDGVVVYNIPYSISFSSTTRSYYCIPDNNESYIDEIGLLYNRYAARNGNNGTGITQGICPSGWHLPSNEEWNTLINYMKSRSEYYCNSSSDNIAKAMASTTGWNASEVECSVGNNQNENNASDFNIKPTIFENSYGTETGYWTSTKTSVYDNAPSYRIRYDSASISIYQGTDPYNVASVRCVKD